MRRALMDRTVTTGSAALGQILVRIRMLQPGELRSLAVNYLYFINKKGVQ
jgi:hypothetical protein